MKLKIREDMLSGGILVHKHAQDNTLTKQELRIREPSTVKQPEGRRLVSRRLREQEDELTDEYAVDKEGVAQSMREQEEIVLPV